MNSQNSRRQFIRDFTLTTVAVSGSLALSACDINSTIPTSVTFVHGVASGDPLSDRIILWSRVTPSNAPEGKDIEVFWKLASDDQFTKIVKTGSALTNAARDYTLKADVVGLSANTAYFYRFLFDTTRSPVGRTKTLPVGNVAQVKMAVFTCSNYPAGYFNVYAEVAKLNDIDVAIHLGDYIYEYPHVAKHLKMLPHSIVQSL